MSPVSRRQQHQVKHEVKGTTPIDRLRYLFTTPRLLLKLIVVAVIAMGLSKWLLPSPLDLWVLNFVVISYGIWIGGTLDVKIREDRIHRSQVLDQTTFEAGQSTSEPER